MDDSITPVERRISAIETQLSDNIAARGEQEQEFARLLIERVGEVLNDFRFALFREQDERSERERLRHVELQRQIDTRFDNFGSEIDIVRDTHQLTQGVGNDVQQLVQEVNTLKSSQDFLSSEFHEWQNALGERVTGLEARLAEHDTILEDFAQSRERSMQRHDETHAQIEQLANELHTFMAHIDALIADNPVIERTERDAILTYVRTLMAREANGDATR